MNVNNEDFAEPKKNKNIVSTIQQGRQALVRIPHLRKFFLSIPYCAPTFTKTLRVIKRLVFVPKFPKFKSDAEKLDPNDFDALLDFALVEWGELIGPMQLRPEIRSLMELLKQRGVKRFMEIGTANGGTLFLLCKSLGKGSAGISLDLPCDSFFGEYPKYKEPFYQSFAGEGQSLRLLRGDSHKPETLANVKGVLGEEKLDFLLIDGDHSYEGVKKDYEMYSPLVKEGGIIAFHDIVVFPPELHCDVHRFWNEVKLQSKSQEFISDPKQTWAGIGIIFK